jgi:photosystem II stability/assembly factor-like uncharacterized protein
MNFRNKALLFSVVVSLASLVILSNIGCSKKEDPVDQQEDVCQLLQLRDSGYEIVFTPAVSLVNLNAGSEVSWTYSDGTKSYTGHIVTMRDDTGVVAYYNATINGKSCVYGTPPPPPRKNYLGVFFFDYDTGWVVGEQGLIRKTINGANSWSDQSSTVSVQLNDLFFLNADTGFVAGKTGTILRTTNGGTSWQLQISGTTEDLNGIAFFLSLQQWTGYAVGNRGVILSTTNFGATWTTMTSNTLQDLYEIQSSDPYGKPIIVGSYGIILKRVTVSPPTWSAIASGTNYLLYGVAMQGTRGVAVGILGTIARTTNSGDTWTTTQTDTLGSLLNVYFWMSYGHIVGANGLIMKSTDRGATWSRYGYTSRYNLNDIFMVDDFNSFAVGDRETVFKTTDAGATWIKK